MSSEENTEELCCVCREPYLCSIDYGSHINLGCGCGLHHECLVHYIRTKLEDKSSMLIFENRSSSSYVKGIICPNFVTGWCKQSPEKYLLPWEDFENIINQATALDISESLSSEEVEKIQKWIFEEEGGEETKPCAGDPNASSDPLIEATTKPCPKCGYRASHAHGHGCHHISPYGGCTSCHCHYCYKCLSSAEENMRVRGGSGNCKCGYWSNFCSSLMGDEVTLYLAYEPYPNDMRCGCVICSCCRPNRPCSQCAGNCVVCRGLLPPGPLSIDEIDAYKRLVPQFTANHRQKWREASLEDRLLQACRNGNWQLFEQIVTTMPPNTPFPIHHQDWHHRTLLHYACHNSSPGAIRIIRYLLEAGADVTALDGGEYRQRRYGKSPLDYALSAYSAMEYSSRRLSQPNPYPIDLLLTMFERRFQNPLYQGLEIYVNETPFLSWIINHKEFYFPFIDRFPSKAMLILSNALINGFWDAARFVLDSFPNFNVSVPDPNGTNGEMMPVLFLISSIAANKFSVPMANIKAASMNAIIRDWDNHVALNPQNRTIIHELIYYALKAYNPAFFVWKNESISHNVLRIIIPLVSILVDSICKETIVTTDGTTVTAREIGEDTFRKNANYNVADDSGNTILHMLAYPFFHHAFIQWVDTYPLSLLAVNSKGDTPLHYLLLHGKFDPIFQYFNSERGKHVLESNNIILPFHVANIMQETPLHNYARNRMRTLRLPSNSLIPKRHVDDEVAIAPPTPDVLSNRVNGQNNVTMRSSEIEEIEDMTGLFEYLKMIFLSKGNRTCDQTKMISEDIINFSNQDSYGYTVFHILIQEHDTRLLQILLTFSATHSLSVPYLARDKLGNTLFYYIFYQIEQVMITQLNHIVRHGWKLASNARKLVFYGFGLGSTTSVGLDTKTEEEEDRQRSNPQYSDDLLKVSFCQMLMKHKPPTIQLESLWLYPNSYQKRTLVEELCHHPSSSLYIFITQLLLPYRKEQETQCNRFLTSFARSMIDSSIPSTTIPHSDNDLLLPQNNNLGSKTALMLLIESCDRFQAPSECSLPLIEVAESSFTDAKMWCLLTITDCLLSNQALYQQDEEGNTILHLAIFNRRKELAFHIVTKYGNFIRSCGRISIPCKEIDDVEDEEEEEDDDDDEDESSNDHKKQDKTERKSQQDRSVLLVQNENGDSFLHILCDYESIYDFHEEDSHKESEHTLYRNIIRQFNSKPLIIANQSLPPNATKENCYEIPKPKPMESWKLKIKEKIDAWDKFAYELMCLLFPPQIARDLVASSSFLTGSEYNIFTLPNRGPKCSILRYALLYHLDVTTSYFLWMNALQYPWETTIRQGIPMSQWIMVHPAFFRLFKQLFQQESIIHFTKDEIIKNILPYCMRMLTVNWNAESHSLCDSLLISSHPESFTADTTLPLLLWLSQMTFSASSQKTFGRMKGLLLILIKERVLDWKFADAPTGFTVIHKLLQYQNPPGIGLLLTTSVLTKEEKDSLPSLPVSPVLSVAQYGLSPIAQAVQDILDIVDIFFTYHNYDIFRPCDRNGNTPLHIGCKQSHYDILVAIICMMNATGSFADPSITTQQRIEILFTLFQQVNQEGDTPLQCLSEETNAIYFLSSLDCFTNDFTATQLKTLFNHPNNAGDALLHQWCRKKWVKGVEYLLSRYKSPLIEDIINQCNAEGWSLLHLLCGDTMFYPSLLSVLPSLTTKADFSLLSKNQQAETPFHRICSKQPLTMEMLDVIFAHCEQHGIDSDTLSCQLDGSSNTPVLLAIKAGETNIPMFRRLLHMKIINHCREPDGNILLVLVKLNRIALIKEFCSFPPSIEDIVFDQCDPVTQDNIFHIIMRYNRTPLMTTLIMILHEHNLMHTVGKKLLEQKDAVGDNIFHILVAAEYTALWVELIDHLVKTDTLWSIGKSLVNDCNAKGDNCIRYIVQHRKFNALETVIERLGIATDGKIAELLDCESMHRRDRDTIVQCILKAMDNKTIRKCLRKAGITL